MDITTIKYPSHNDLVQWYYQLAQSIAEAAGVTPEDVNALIAAYIEEHPYPVVPADVITESNAAQNVVTSVNGKKGDVTVTGGGDVPENVVTTDNIGQNAVTSFNGLKGDVTGVKSVNGQTGEVTVPGVPANVLTADNIGQNAVTRFNGAVGEVTGVTSVNGLTGPNVSLATSGDGVIDIRIAPGLHILIQHIPVVYGVGGTSRYVGTIPKNGKTNIYTLLSAFFTTDPTPFTPNSAGFDTSEGVWTLFFSGLSSGTAPSVGDTKYALVAAIVS